ncbi:YceI family protein [Frateuria soli]|uniref:YceI family protein n=1 Tax=Frateuria soli TaxID=1542730 RepID=UPI001E499BDC|nr:YceI family protein [Frateuria soli]UGB37511.1 YceI family protein [Frateuria soli]
MSALPATARLLACAALLWPLATHAAEHRYRYDTVHSQVLFSVSHDGYSRPFGRLHIARGWLRFDPDDWSRAATALDIDLASLDMGDADWNAAVLKPALLDAGKARYAHFASTSVERKDDSHGVLHGNLTLRGVTRPIDIPFTFNRQARTIFGLHTIAGFSANTMLDRTDFGMTAHPDSIGQHVSVWLEIEAIREERRRESADAAQ